MITLVPLKAVTLPFDNWVVDDVNLQTYNQRMSYGHDKSIMISDGKNAAERNE